MQLARERAEAAADGPGIGVGRQAEDGEGLVASHVVLPLPGSATVGCPTDGGGGVGDDRTDGEGRSGVAPARPPRATPDEIVDRLRAARPDPADAAAVARWMRLGLLPHHAVVYGAPEVHARLEALGIAEPFARYLAQRAAPLGPVPAGVVTATFHGFGPAAVAAHVPAVWDVADPAAVVAATLDGIGALLERVLADGPARAAAERLGAALGPVAAAHPTAGRPLAAAWAGVTATGRPLVDLWLATTVMRESRGDGHVAVLVAEGVGPLASHLLVSGDDPRRRPALARWRAWREEDVAAEGERLRAEGLLDADGRPTAEARAWRERIEARTDATCDAPWTAVDPGTVESIVDDALVSGLPLIASGALLGPALAGLAAA